MGSERLKIGFRTYELPATLDAKIQQLALDHWALDLNNEKSLRRLAGAILQMSDYYADSPSDKTPWDESWCQQAQLCYFLPLNYLRNRTVVEEGKSLGFFNGITSAVDFGAGLGAASLALSEIITDLQSTEVSSIANALRSEIVNSGSKNRGDLLVCSYSLTEDNQIDFKDFQNLMILEPSTSEDARALQRLRQTLIDKGYSIWAPCTHQKGCPLLLHSEKDWCHDRIHFKRPAWFLELEKHLPMKNENLTFSYLLAAKRVAPDLSTKARFTGDTLDEKGKSRQLFCRGEAREYLSMLNRDGELPEISRGALLEVPAGGTSIASEYRIKKFS